MVFFMRESLGVFTSCVLKVRETIQDVTFDKLDVTNHRVGGIEDLPNNW